MLRLAFMLLCLRKQLLVSTWLSSACMVQMQSVLTAGGLKANRPCKVQAATATLQHASTAKQPPKGLSAADAAAAVASAAASATIDNEVQVRKVASASTFLCKCVLAVILASLVL